MRKSFICLVVVSLVGLVIAEDGKPAVKTRTFSEDLSFLKKHTDVIVLQSGGAKVAIVPEYQGRVMTSTTGGKDDTSYGFLNCPVIEKGILAKDEAKGRLEEHIYVFGGEERFWLGPEGGQYAIYFRPGSKFVFDDWCVPALIDTDKFKIMSLSEKEAVFSREAELVNYSTNTFKVRINRAVKILEKADVEDALGLKMTDGLGVVAYESKNELVNVGANEWKKEQGLLSIWILGMYNPSPDVTVVIPFNKGADSNLGSRVNDTYFGRVPAEKLIVKDDILFFSGDGAYRSKIGINPKRSKGIAGSYDAASKTLTVVIYNKPVGNLPYVNSMWERQVNPYEGDAINSYNDGVPAPGKKPLGPFYEIETSSPALELRVNEGYTHIQKTFHVQGPENELDAVSKRLFDVSIEDIKKALNPVK